MSAESQPKVPRFLSLVRVNFSHLSPEDRAKYPFVEQRPYIFFGEIPNMAGHCVVADHKSGQIYSGYHIENFEEIPVDET